MRLLKHKHCYFQTTDPLANHAYPSNCATLHTNPTRPNLMHERQHTTPCCPQCGQDAQLVESNRVYPNATTDYGWLWVCWDCDTRVGCHKGTQHPKGTLAGPALRAARKEVHRLFDPLWKRVALRDHITPQKARGRAYKWLASELDIPQSECHIAMFDEARCAQAIARCRAIGQHQPKPH